MNFCSVHLPPLRGKELDHACPQHLAQYLFGPYKALLSSIETKTHVVYAISHRQKG